MFNEHSAQNLRGRTIRVILFDIGHTLWESLPHNNEQELAANTRGLAVLELHLPTSCFTSENRTALKANFRRVLLNKFRAYIDKDPEHEPNYAHIINELLPDFSLPQVSVETANEVYQALAMPMHILSRLFDDTLSTLEALRERGFLLGVVSNRYWGGQGFLEDMQYFGLMRYFTPETMAISADLGVRKPNPAIFEHTLNALHVAPEEAVMVGDSLYADILGARNLNIFAVWKPKSRLIAQFKNLARDQNKPVSDDAFFTYVAEHEKTYYQKLYTPVKPDLTIENLHDLLGVFHKAGEQ